MGKTNVSCNKVNHAENLFVNKNLFSLLIKKRQTQNLLNLKSRAAKTLHRIHNKKASGPAESGK